MRLAAFSVRNFQFTLVMFFLMTALGWHTWKNIPRGEDPTFPIPVVTVVAVYPGADPADMEKLVADPLEDA
ncbi:efflux RND transporter permease subunit, partial [Acinetobacter baumannii]